jgi:hypothetical protein
VRSGPDEVLNRTLGDGAAYLAEFTADRGDLA